MYRPPQRQQQQWGLISVEIVAVGTALAAGTIVALVSMPDRLSAGVGNFDRAVIFALGIVSLGAYLAAVVLGLSAPFQETAQARKAYSSRAGFAVIIQATVVFGVALFLILSFLSQKL